MAVVIIFSVMERTSLALVTVVSIRPFSSRKVTIARSIAVLWLEVLPSFLVPGIEFHSLPLVWSARGARAPKAQRGLPKSPRLVVVFTLGEVEPQGLELPDDLLQGLLAQVADLHHLFGRHVDQVRHRVDVGPFQAVKGANR